ncbi:hypothetical protein FQN49_005834 [Arthroderma sp. PD_2]|nr:hypothetical protein FQN49_005834 [Arthroderma sp. PD_2]
MASSEKEVVTPQEKTSEKEVVIPQEKIKDDVATVTATESPASPDLDPMLNSSGHRQELDRNFSLISMCAIGVTAGNTWIAMGGSIVSAPPLLTCLTWLSGYCQRLSAVTKSWIGY